MSGYYSCPYGACDSLGLMQPSDFQQAYTLTASVADPKLYEQQILLARQAPTAVQVRAPATDASGQLTYKTAVTSPSQYQSVLQTMPGASAPSGAPAPTAPTDAFETACVGPVVTGKLIAPGVCQLPNGDIVKKSDLPGAGGATGDAKSNTLLYVGIGVVALLLLRRRK